MSVRPAPAVTGDQSAAMAFLSDPATHGGAPVERIDTHASSVFLAGSHAFKLKRAVKYDYLDFSTPDRRRAMCEAEVAVNRRIAPDLYRAVRAITRSSGGVLSFDGDGEAVDWVVEMTRFDQAGLFDRLAAAGALDLRLMRPLAEAVAAFHLAADPTPGHGGPESMRAVIAGNEQGLREHGAHLAGEAERRRLTAASYEELARVADTLGRRQAGGFVRRCHGDLHLRNIVLWRGVPTLFDAIEFNDDFSCIDVFYDLAFLLMDLWRRDLPHHANAVLNAYLAETADDDGLAPLPLFLSCRAAVRAKTSAAAAALHDDAARRVELEELSRKYLRLAMDLLRAPQPVLVAIGGLSGTGKSTVARGIAPGLGSAPGAVILRSDTIRKGLLGVSETTRLGGDAYRAEISSRVYATMRERARAVLAAGHSVVADAVFLQPDERSAIEEVAADAGARFAGIWLDAPVTTLVARVAARRGDASDAGADVIAWQREQDRGAVAWHHVDAEGPPDQVLGRTLAVLGVRS